MEHVYFTPVRFSRKRSAPFFETHRKPLIKLRIRVGNPPLCISVEGQENVLLSKIILFSIVSYLEHHADIDFRNERLE
jgi:hypothetical protein